MTDKRGKEELITRFFETIREKEELLVKFRLGLLSPDESVQFADLVEEQNQLMAIMIGMKMIQIQIVED